MCVFTSRKQGHPQKFQEIPSLSPLASTDYTVTPRGQGVCGVFVLEHVVTQNKIVILRKKKGKNG